jgi:hypothetical protein
MSDWKSTIKFETIEHVKQALNELEKGNINALTSIQNRINAAELLLDDDVITLIQICTTPLFRFITSEIKDYQDGPEFAKKIAINLKQIFDSWENNNEEKLYIDLKNFAHISKQRRKETELKIKK